MTYQGLTALLPRLLRRCAGLIGLHAPGSAVTTATWLPLPLLLLLLLLHLSPPRQPALLLPEALPEPTGRPMQAAAMRRWA